MTYAEANFHIGRAQSQEPTNQESGSQRGSFSTPTGLRNVEQQNTNPVVSKGSGFFSSLRNFFSKPQAPALESSAPRVVPKSPLISALETLVALSDKDFPKNEKDLVAHVQNCTDEQATAINQTLAAAENVYLAEHCDEDKKGEFTQKKGAPSQAEFYKGKLQELLNKTIASEAQAVSSTEEAQPGNSNNTRKVSSGPTFFKEAIERHAKVIEEVDNFNTAINELSDELEKNNEDFNVANFLGSKNLSESDKKVISDYVDSNISDPSLSIKVLRLKKNVNPNQEGVKHFIGSLFARPTTSISIKSASMPTKQDIKDAFLDGSYNLAKAIFKLDQVDITGNHVSNFLNKHINDHSHSEAVRTAITAVTTIVAMPIFFTFRALKWVAVHALGVLAHAVTYVLPRALAVAAVVGLIALCIFKPAIGLPVLFGVILLASIINQIFMRKEIKEQKRDILDLKADNERLTEYNQKVLKLLTQLTEEREKERRLNVSPDISFDSSERVSLDAQHQVEGQLEAGDADDAGLLAQQAVAPEGDVQVDAPVVNVDPNAQQNADDASVVNDLARGLT